MAKTKAELIALRKATYRDQLPERCCGTCRYIAGHAGDHWCKAVVIRRAIQDFDVVESGYCDLYEPKDE